MSLAPSIEGGGYGLTIEEKNIFPIASATEELPELPQTLQEETLKNETVSETQKDETVSGSPTETHEPTPPMTEIEPVAPVAEIPQPDQTTPSAETPQPAERLSRVLRTSRVRPSPATMKRAVETAGATIDGTIRVTADVEIGIVR